MSICLNVLLLLVIRLMSVFDPGRLLVVRVGN